MSPYSWIRVLLACQWLGVPWKVTLVTALPVKRGGWAETGLHALLHRLSWPRVCHAKLSSPLKLKASRNLPQIFPWWVLIKKPSMMCPQRMTQAYINISMLRVHLPDLWLKLLQPLPFSVVKLLPKWDGDFPLGLRWLTSDLWLPDVLCSCCALMALQHFYHHKIAWLMWFSSWNVFLVKCAQITVFRLPQRTHWSREKK